jgi:hypothetical protein
MRSIRNFFKKRDGLATVEWVVLCAVVLLAAAGISKLILQSADGLGGSVAKKMCVAAGPGTPGCT